MVQTCVPNLPGINCNTDGYMLVVVGQEVYESSPFTLKINRIMRDDVSEYYLTIFIIFFVGKLLLFCVLWNWLRVRVTDRMIALTRKLQTSDQSDAQSNYQKQ